jgi:hypothetical protein
MASTRQHELNFELKTTCRALTAEQLRAAGELTDGLYHRCFLCAVSK